MRSPRRFISWSSGSGSFPGAGVPGAGFRGRVVMGVLLPSAWCCLSSPGGGGVGRERARDRSGELAFGLREAAVSRREREPVVVAHRVDDADLEIHVQVAYH